MKNEIDLNIMGSKNKQPSRYEAKKNKCIKLICDKYPLIKTFDIRKRRDGKWGDEVIHTDLINETESVIWNHGDLITLDNSGFIDGTHSEDGFITKPQIKIDDKTKISIFFAEQGGSVKNSKGRNMILWVSYVSGLDRHGNPSKWNVHEVYNETLPIENWLNPLNEKRIEKKKQVLLDFKKQIKIK